VDGFTVDPADVAYLLESDVSLDDEHRASVITSYVMENGESDETKALLDGIYHTKNFYQFFSSVRNQVQDFFLDGSTTQLTKLDLVMGY